jgi:uncharacterized membrane protein YedE/YeeE
MQGQLDWLRGGIALGLVFLLAVALVKPIGVSTQFVIADGIVWSLFSKDVVRPDAAADSGYTSDNDYLAKSGGKYAKSVAKPVNYSFVFVLAMILGGVLSRLTGGPKVSGAERVVPAVWRERFGAAAGNRLAWAFVGGFLVLFGARLAGGCTSGHMMSGIMQTSLSGYLFALGAFAVAVPAALLLYGRK